MKTCILAYHKLFNNNEYNNESYSLLESTFELQMKYLSEIGFRATLICDIANNKLNNRKNVLITFDDGYSSDYKIAFPILKKHGLTGTFFITGNHIGKKGYMDWQQIIEMNRVRMSIQPHGLNHVPLTALSEEELKNELLISKIMLEEKIGTPVRYFSVPGGFHSKKVFRMAETLQYNGAFTSIPGFVPEINLRQRFKIFNRFIITRKTDFNTFKAIVNFNRTIETYYKSGYLFKMILKKLVGNKTYQMLWEKFLKEM